MTLNVASPSADLARSLKGTSRHFTINISSDTKKWLIIYLAPARRCWVFSYKFRSLHALATLCHIKCFSSLACLSGISDVVEYHHIFYIMQLSLHYAHDVCMWPLSVFRGDCERKKIVRRFYLRYFFVIWKWFLIQLNQSSKQVPSISIYLTSSHNSWWQLWLIGFFHFEINFCFYFLLLNWLRRKILNFSYYVFYQINQTSFNLVNLLNCWTELSINISCLSGFWAISTWAIHCWLN